MMKQYISFLAGFICLALFSCKNIVEKRKSINYVWHQSHIGGGGFIAGILQDQHNADILYIRSDVGGVFKTIDGGKTWFPVNKGMVHSWDHNVETFAISPHNSNILFRCSGELRDRTSVGNIYKTINGGNTWYNVCDKADFFGNGPTRSLAEKIAVDPFDSSMVVAASYSKGLWISRDGGEHWKNAGFNGAPMGCVKFHPYKKNCLYFITLPNRSLKEYLFPNGSYKNNLVGEIHFSSDKGKTWRILYSQKGMMVNDLAFDKDNPEILYATFGKGSFQKSMDGGKSFIAKTKGLSNTTYGNISVDPNNKSVIYISGNRWPGQNNVPEIPLYRSPDKGESWQLLKNTYSMEDFKKLPFQFDRPEVMGWSIGKILVDVKNPRKIYFSNLFTVTKSYDLGLTWDCDSFKGIENICIESIQKDPSSNNVWFIAADVQPGLSKDYGENYQEIKYLNHPNTYYSSTTIVASRFRKNFILYSVINSNTQRAAFIRSSDNGVTRSFVWHLNKGLFVQAIREDYFTSGVFYAYIDGYMQKGAGIYKTDNWGTNWQKLNLSLPPYIDKLPFHKKFIEGELLAVTVNQSKNVCGTNQLMALDPFYKGTIYLGEATEGIFATNNDGKNWVNIGKGLPFSKDSTAILNCIKTDENRKGVIYAGFIKNGLWRTVNSGKSWNKIYPQNNKTYNSNTFDIGGADGNHIVIGCEPMYWSSCKASLVVSNDFGITWTDIMDRSLGAIRTKAIAIDKHNNIYVGTSGNSMFVIHPESSKNDLGKGLSLKK